MCPSRVGVRFEFGGGDFGVRLGCRASEWVPGCCVCVAGLLGRVRRSGWAARTRSRLGCGRGTNDGSLFSDINAAPQPSFISTIFTIFITSTVTSSTSSSESVWSRKPLYSTYLNIATFSSHIKKSCSYVYCEILHVYVCMYACTYACLMYVGVYVRMCLCMCVMYVGMHAHTYACMYL